MHDELLRIIDNLIEAYNEGRVKNGLSPVIFVGTVIDFKSPAKPIERNIPNSEITTDEVIDFHNSLEKVENFDFLK